MGIPGYDHEPASQTTAQVIITNVPEDASSSHVCHSKGSGEDRRGGIMITDQDGEKLRADQDTLVTPYLTRNIVTLVT